MMWANVNPLIFWPVAIPMFFLALGGLSAIIERLTK